MKKLIIPLFLASFFISSPSVASIIMSPYVMAVTKNSVYVLVETNTPDTVTVQYGFGTSYGFTAKSQSIDTTTASPKTYMHNVLLINLIPDTLYNYKAIHGSSISANSTFRTAVDAITNFRFVWMADCRTGVEVHDRISALLLAANPRFYLNGGDLCHGSTYEIFKTEYFRTNELSLISKIPFFLSAGNHEGWTQNTKAFSQAPSTPSSPLGDQAYYSFDYGNIHILVLNTELPCSVGSAQYIFAENDLPLTTKTWKIVIFHKPAYCSGGEGSSSEMRIITTNVFEPNHVDMAITGHSHFYQHNYLNGIHHMVLGAGGGPLQDPTSEYYTVKSVKDYNWATIDVTPSQFFMTVYNDSNYMLDTIRLIKNPGYIKHEVYTGTNYKLSQNYPNPFNPSTAIRYDLPKAGFVKLTVFDALGREVESLVNEKQSAGTYEVTFSGMNYPSGVYFYRLQSGDYTDTKRLLLLK
jgi:3',5'-cyclic AMP phosphodiesterase CpdA